MHCAHISTHKTPNHVHLEFYLSKRWWCIFILLNFHSSGKNWDGVKHVDFSHMYRRLHSVLTDQIVLAIQCRLILTITGSFDLIAKRNLSHPSDST